MRSHAKSVLRCTPANFAAAAVVNILSRRSACACNAESTSARSRWSGMPADSKAAAVVRVSDFNVRFPLREVRAHRQPVRAGLEMRACLQKGKTFSPHVLPASERTKPAPALNGTRFPFPLKSGFPSPSRTGFPSPSWKGRERSGASGPPQRSAHPGDGRPAIGTGREKSRRKPPQARARSATVNTRARWYRPRTGHPARHGGPAAALGPAAPATRRL